MAGLNQKLVNWQNAPAEYELVNYDEFKLRYRKYVEDFVKPLIPKSLRKRKFFTIVTNVLCADLESSRETIDPIDKDIYLPLEIAITKWTLNDAKLAKEEREMETKFWMIDPGRPSRGSICAALDHKKKHKIDFDWDQPEQNSYIEPDLEKVMKELNSFLSPDRTVYSMNINHIRQDLGSLKWLNRETGYKTKPISVYSLEDLYVVLIRHLNPNYDHTVMCQSIANHRLSNHNDAYNTDLQCLYHRVKAKLDEDGETCYCALALSVGYSNVIVDDVDWIANP